MFSLKATWESCERSTYFFYLLQVDQQSLIMIITLTAHVFSTYTQLISNLVFIAVGTFVNDAQF